MNYVADKRNVPLHPEEARALKTVIGNYFDYLERMIPSSTERNRLLSVLQGVYTRLQRLLVLGQQIEGQRLWLTEEEVAALDMALLTFLRLVHLIIKPSQQRDDTVDELEKMRWRIRSLSVPPLH